jgi:8-oxo-dGTP diphosphatase
MSRKITHVAAAVIYGENGTVLLGQRAPGTFYPGYWEFPGGKVEAGETPRDALVRELQEELGIEVLEATPWLRIEHEYEHAHVCLHFFRVTAWRGTLHDHVHTGLEWQRPDQFTVSPMLPANGPILKSLSLPAWYGITHAGEIGEAEQLAALKLALVQGMKLVQVREPELTPERRLAFAKVAVELAHRYGARVLINGADEGEALARAVGADGVHLPSHRLMALTERPDFEWVGTSCHNPEELLQAQRLSVDFAVLGAVQATASHPDRAALGWELVAEWIPVSLPVYLLGGLGPKNLPQARQLGAQGIAAIRSAWATG